MRVFALVLLVTTAVAPVSADTTAIQAAVQGRVSGVSLSETQGPAASGSLLADLTWGPGQGFAGVGLAHAYAAQTDSGTSAVEVDAYPTLANQDFQSAESRWARTITNNTGRTVEYIYRFSVAPPVLALRKAGGFNEPRGTASYFMSIQLNGQTLFTSGATLSGVSANPQLVELGTDFGGVLFRQPSLGIYGFQFSAYEGVLSLGFHPAGTTFTVETVIRVSSDIPGLATGARAAIGDPLDIGGLPGLASDIIIGDVVGVESVGWSAIKNFYR